MEGQEPVQHRWKGPTEEEAISQGDDDEGSGVIAPPKAVMSTTESSSLEEVNVLHVRRLKEDQNEHYHTEDLRGGKFIQDI